jgi:hypothetical protein
LIARGATGARDEVCRRLASAPPGSTGLLEHLCCAWRLEPPTGWRLELDGDSAAVGVEPAMALVRETSSEVLGSPTPDFTDALAYAPERWDAMLSVMAGTPLLSSQGSTVADAGWMRRLGADRVLATTAADWASEWQTLLCSRLEDAAREKPALATALGPVLAGFAPIIKGKEKVLGYRLAPFPFVVSAIAFLARLRAWRLIEPHLPGLTRNDLDRLVLQARQWAPERLERELLLADLLIGTWGDTPATSEASRA